MNHAFGKNALAPVNVSGVPNDPQTGRSACCQTEAEMIGWLEQRMHRWWGNSGDISSAVGTNFDTSI